MIVLWLRIKDLFEAKDIKGVVMYAGGLHERYGLKKAYGGIYDASSREFSFEIIRVRSFR